MPVCELCGKKVKVVYKCKACGARFCENCGDKNRLLCDDCIEYEEGAQGKYRLEQDIETDND